MELRKKAPAPVPAEDGVCENGGAACAWFGRWGIESLDFEKLREKLKITLSSLGEFNH